MSDGDGINVKGHRIRITGVDVPEQAQEARLRDGTWVDEGKRAKNALFRKIAGMHVQVAATFRRNDGRTLYLRKATLAESAQLQIYTALGLNPSQTRLPGWSSDHQNGA